MICLPVLGFDFSDGLPCLCGSPLLQHTEPTEESWKLEGLLFRSFSFRNSARKGTYSLVCCCGWDLRPFFCSLVLPGAVLCRMATITTKFQFATCLRSQASSLPVCWMRRTQGNLLRLGNAMPQSSWGCTPYYTWAAGRFHLECRFSLTAGKENQLDWFQVTAAVALPCLGVLQTGT